MTTLPPTEPIGCENPPKWTPEAESLLTKENSTGIFYDTSARALRPKDGKVKAALFGNTGPAGETLEAIYGAHMQKLRDTTDLYPAIVTSDNLDQCLAELADIQAIFATWGFFPLTPEVLDRLPRLEAVFYAAGSVGHFAGPLFKRGIIVTSSAAANAVPVAEFTLGQILLANKGYFRNLREYRACKNLLRSFSGRGNYNATVAILGLGKIGLRLLDLLKPFSLRIVVCDEFLSHDQAISLGVEKVSLREAFARGDVVSNHLADVDETAGLLTKELFSLMPVDATFINTGRGRTVDASGLASVLGRRPDLTALLDVTDPEEPLQPDSVFWKLPNALVSSHIAGSKGNEAGRVADLALAEFERWVRGEPLLHAVTPDALDATSDD
jgi:phosphoglycerate dehydrogenase-like enzyme